MAGLQLAPDYTEFLQLYYKQAAPAQAHSSIVGGFGNNLTRIFTPLTEPALISRDTFLLYNGGLLPAPSQPQAPSAVDAISRQVQIATSVTTHIRESGENPQNTTNPSTTSQVQLEVDDAGNDGNTTVKLVQGKVSTAVSEPLPAHTARRKAVEEQIATTMDDLPFSLKCQIYRNEMHLIVREQQRLKARTHVPALKSPPVLVLNSYERKLLSTAGPLTEMPGTFNEPSATIRGRSNEDIFQEVLNSLTNRVLFLVMIEYRSWFPQDRARSQIVRCVLKALSPETLPPALVSYVANFVVQRTKNFRDVISRVCKRDKSHHYHTSTSSMED